MFKATRGYLHAALTVMTWGGWFLYALWTHALHEVQIECGTRNVYMEARDEPATAKEKLAQTVFARLLDRDPQWRPKTLCGIVYQKGQYSWTRNKVLWTSRPNNRRAWDESEHIVRRLYWDLPRFTMPAGWACVRYYKRTDDRFTSKNGRTFFEKLVRIADEFKPQFGSHSAFEDPARCVTPMPEKGEKRTAGP